jgi:D-alanine-D-alanine ligase
MTKRVLTYHNLPNAVFQVFSRHDAPVDDDLLNEAGELRFPLFVKPSREGTGIGVHAKSVVETVGELREAVRELQAKYQQPILAEQYIAGREVTVGVLGNMKKTSARRLNERTAPHVMPQELTMFPSLEINMEHYPTEGGIYTNRVKVELVHDFYWTCPADLDAAMDEQLKLLTAATFRVMGCYDVARVDFRIHAEGQPYILEINPLPGLNPEYSDLCIEAKAMGWTYEQLINAIVDCAAQRYGL